MATSFPETHELKLASVSQSDFVDHWVGHTVAEQVSRGNKLRNRKSTGPIPGDKFNKLISDTSNAKPFCPDPKPKNSFRDKSLKLRRRAQRSLTKLRAKLSRKTSPVSVKIEAIERKTASAGQGRIKPLKKCPLRIAELAAPTKRQCLSTYSSNARKYLPDFMLERLKHHLTEEDPLVQVHDAVECFKRHKSTLKTKRSPHNSTTSKRTSKESKKTAEFRQFCLYFGRQVADRLSCPLQLTLIPELQGLSDVVYSDINKVYKKRHVPFVFYESVNDTKIQAEVSAKVAVWITIVLQEASLRMLQDDVKDLDEEVGPALDVLDAIVDSVPLLSTSEPHLILEEGNSTVGIKDQETVELEESKSQEFDVETTNYLSTETDEREVAGSNIDYGSETLDQKSVETERQESSETERQESSETERQDSSETERQDSSETERQDSNETGRQDSSETEKQDSSETDRQERSDMFIIRNEIQPKNEDTFVLHAEPDELAEDSVAVEPQDDTVEQDAADDEVVNHLHTNIDENVSDVLLDVDDRKWAFSSNDYFRPNSTRENSTTGNSTRGSSTRRNSFDMSIDDDSPINIAMFLKRINHPPQPKQYPKPDVKLSDANEHLLSDADEIWPEDATLLMRAIGSVVKSVTSLGTITERASRRKSTYDNTHHYPLPSQDDIEISDSNLSEDMDDAALISCEETGKKENLQKGLIPTTEQFVKQSAVSLIRLGIESNTTIGLEPLDIAIDTIYMRNILTPDGLTMQTLSPVVAEVITKPKYENKKDIEPPHIAVDTINNMRNKTLTPDFLTKQTFSPVVAVVISKQKHENEKRIELPDIAVDKINMKNKTLAPDGLTMQNFLPVVAEVISNPEYENKKGIELTGIVVDTINTRNKTLSPDCLTMQTLSPAVGEDLKPKYEYKKGKGDHKDVEIEKHINFEGLRRKSAESANKVKFDYRCHPKSAPAWALRGHCKIHDDTMITRTSSLSQCVIRKWCKDLETTAINLEQWYRWIDRTCKSILKHKTEYSTSECLTTTVNDKQCAGRSTTKSKLAKTWLTLHKSVEKDAQLWTKLNEGTSEALGSYSFSMYNNYARNGNVRQKAGNASIDCCTNCNCHNGYRTTLPIAVNCQHISNRKK